MWQTFLSRLRSATGAESALILLEGAGDRIVLESGEARASGIERWLDPQPSLREGRVYSGEELGANAAGTFRLMRTRRSEGISATLALADGDFDASVSSLLTLLLPHLEVALRTFAEIEREKARSAVSEGVASRMNFGWITLDQRGRIVDCNPAAERTLQVSGLLARGAYDRLVPSSAMLDRELSAIVRECSGNPDVRPRALNLSHDPWIELLVSPVRFEGLGAGGQAVAVVYLRGDRSSQADRREQLVDLFQLTPGEARVAWSMAQGLSIAEAAEEHGLTIETARFYSKKIYAKTGARGQSDLVRNILTSVLALA
ncbi:helix-turn-helix transcriptional regulator [Altererythrobacter sp. MF3-039]|uniref:helix-turn-helix transcriptional regulator n=1 Tax=Altererythrobacter sp. MF3-039 TaxID=3252901 RepID=UPI00390C4D07